MSSYINVTDAPYNAALDGITDDTTAINTALAASTGIVYIPTGTALISASLTVPTNVHVIGNGIGATVIKPTANPTFGAVTFSGNDSSISNLTVNGNATGTTARGACGIYALTGSNRIAIYNCEVYASADNGIESDGVDTEIYFNYVHDCFTNGIYVIGVLTTRATGIWIHHNRVEDNSSGTITWDGICIDPTHADCRVEDNWVIGNDIIVYENQGEVSNSYGDRVNNNFIQGSPENGIYLAGTLLDIECCGNYIDSPTGYGIFTNGYMTRFEIKNNRIYAPTMHGIYMENNGSINSNTLSNGEISGNHIENPSSVSNTYSGILITSGTDLFITNNKILDTRGTVLMKYAINTNSASNDVVIFGNKTKSGVSGNIIKSAGQTGANNY